MTTAMSLDWNLVRRGVTGFRLSGEAGVSSRSHIIMVMRPKISRMESTPLFPNRDDMTEGSGGGRA
jgi:hypothetical protein